MAICFSKNFNTHVGQWFFNGTYTRKSIEEGLSQICEGKVWAIWSQESQLCGERVRPVQLSSPAGMVPAQLSVHTAGSADLNGPSMADDDIYQALFHSLYSIDHSILDRCQRGFTSG